MCVEIGRPHKAKPCSVAGMCPLGRDLGLNPACSVGWEWAHLARVTNIPIFTQTMLVTGFPPVVRDSVSLTDCSNFCECWSGGNLPLGHFQQQRGSASSGITFPFPSCLGSPLHQARTPRKAPAAPRLQLFPLSPRSTPLLRARASSTAARQDMASRGDTRGLSTALQQDTASFPPSPKPEVPLGTFTPKPTPGPRRDSSASRASSPSHNMCAHQDYRHPWARSPWLGFSKPQGIQQPQHRSFQLNFPGSRCTDPPEGSGAPLAREDCVWCSCGSWPLLLCLCD